MAAATARDTAGAGTADRGGAVRVTALVVERVTQVLLDRGHVSPRQADEARRMQGFFGGQIESHLLRLGYIDESLLGETLSELTGAPYASADLLRRVPQEVLDLVPGEVAQRHSVFPFRIEGRTVRVAMLNPRDTRVLAELQSSSPYEIEPWIASEYRLYQAIERHYRIATTKIRSISLAPPRSARPRDARGETIPAQVSPAETEPRVGLDGLPLDAEVDLTAALFRAREASADDGETGPAAGPADVEARPTRESARQDRPADDASSLLELEARLAAAHDRDEIAEALMDFCAHLARRCALFAIGQGQVRGISGRGKGFEVEAIRKVQVALAGSTIFDSTLKSRGFYFGAVPALPANRDLFTVLGGQMPATCLVVPIVVRERNAAMLYLDDVDQPMARVDIRLARRVAAKAGIAFELLLLRNKLLAI